MATAIPARYSFRRPWFQTSGEVFLSKLYWLSRDHCLKIVQLTKADREPAALALAGIEMKPVLDRPRIRPTLRPKLIGLRGTVALAG